MTTKELLSRLAAFSELDTVSVFFSDPNFDKCYQASVLTSDSRMYFYFISLDDFPALVHDLNVYSVLIDSFTRKDFDIQLKYFKAFYNRASQNQKDYIKRSLLVSNIFKFLDDSSSK